MTVTNNQNYPQFPSGGDPTGFVLINSGVIASPVSTIPIPLPEGYLLFNFTFVGFDFDNTGEPEILTFAVSDDAGETFINDTGNADSYLTLFSGGSVDMLGYFTDILTVGISTGNMTHATIFPGSDTDTFSAISVFCVMNGNAVRDGRPSLTKLNPLADTTPTPSRINFLQVQPYGNGDADPPTSTHRFTRGWWALSGVPIP